MNRRRWTVWLGALLLVALAVTGYFAIAAEVGSKEDPLVTLSYINEVLSPETMAEIQKAIDAQKAGLDSQIKAKLDAAGAEMDKKVAEYKAALASGTVSDAAIDAIADQVIAKLQAEGLAGTGAPAAANTWAVVKVDGGKKLIGDLGCEIILRIGSATCTAPSAPGLINLTGGSDLAGGGALAANNLYIVTVANNRGFVAGSGGCTVLVNGGYKIG